MRLTTNDCEVVRVETPEGTLYVIIIEDHNGKPYEVKIELGKSGTIVRAWTEVASRLISSLLANGVELRDIIPIISNAVTDRSRTTGKGRVNIRSGSDGIAYAFYRYLDNKYPYKWDRRHSRLIKT